MIETLVRLLRRTRCDDRLYECRQCGTTVSASDESCPTCNSSEISRYDLY